ncbi:MAG TPA: MBL fold metallo-hydrolase [Candidatus Eubacterium faecigallinarum]|nr:MBL fold metallo-hydrolase [Candidatus Eubacterium faecigallinarum]
MLGRIHFLNTGHSDCIILESQGKIAMIDAAEDTEYPPNKPHLNLKGYEDQVVDYLLKNFSDSEGKVNIEFVMGTHAHSDHIGGFDTVINHPDINVKTAYLKPYHEENIFFYERKSWDNVEVYTQMLDAIKANSVELIESFDRQKVKLGDFEIEFLNGTYRKRRIKFGENINSAVAVVKIGKYKSVLAGDLNYKDGDEKRLAPQIGKVDLLKVGHHGYVGSTSAFWIKSLMPKYAIVCNWSKAIYPDVRLKLEHISKSQIIATADVNGAIVEFSDNSIDIKTDIM